MTTQAGSRDAFVLSALVGLQTGYIQEICLNNFFSVFINAKKLSFDVISVLNWFKLENFQSTGTLINIPLQNTLLFNFGLAFLCGCNIKSF